LEQLVVEIIPLPLVLAECCPLALAADLSQQPLLQDGVVYSLAKFMKSDGLINLQSRTSKFHSALIKKRDFGFVFALIVEVVWASLAESIASGCELQHCGGVTHESGHVFNKSLVITIALEEQYAQSVVWAQGGWRVCRLAIFHLSGFSIRIVTDRAISWKKCKVGWR